jgi:hypothetical protein
MLTQRIPSFFDVPANSISQKMFSMSQASPLVEPNFPEWPLPIADNGLAHLTSNR